MTEIQKTLDVQSIADAYGYAPPKISTPRVDLGLSWSDGDGHIEAFNGYDQISEATSTPAFDRVGRDGKRTLKFLLHEESLGSLGGGVVLKSHKNQREGQKDSLSFELERGDANIAQIYLRQEASNQWEINDRAVDSSYRRQGIASQMVKHAELALQARANQTGQAQEVMVNTAQLPVLNLFLKQGYEVVPEDQEAFLKIQNADPSLNIVSSPEDQEYQEKVWYVVDRAKYEDMGERNFWELDVPRKNRTGKYMRESYRIRLRKILTPSSTSIELAQERVGEQLDDVLSS